MKWVFKSKKKIKPRGFPTILLAIKPKFEPKLERDKKIQTREAACSYALVQSKNCDTYSISTL
jgi:hypothetical protein